MSSTRASLAEVEPRVGIALSGGGARGIAHIGVLKALLEHGIVPSVVAGTSSGAIVGCLYAYGMSVEQMTDFARIGSSLRILRIGNPLKGFMKLTMLREKLEGLLSHDDFSCLVREFHVVTSDLQHGRVAVHTSGSLIDVVQASCAIPLVFRPIELNGVQHVDGGLYMNLPANPVRDRVDVLIGSNVMPLVNEVEGPLSTMLGIGQRVFDLSVNATTAPSAALCDVLIEPAEVARFNVYNFTRTEELIEAGYQAGLLEVPRVKALIAKRRTERQKTSTRQSSAGS